MPDVVRMRRQVGPHERKSHPNEIAIVAARFDHKVERVSAQLTNVAQKKMARRRRRLTSRARSRAALPDAIGAAGCVCQIEIARVHSRSQRCHAGWLPPEILALTVGSKNVADPSRRRLAADAPAC